MTTTPTDVTETQRLLAMTPEQHLAEAARILADPNSNHTLPYLHILAHLGMAQVKQAAATT